MATVTSKGQITIPVEVRRALGLKTGSKINFVPTDRGTYEMVPVTRSIKELRGTLPKLGRTVTVEEMNEAIAEGAAGEFDW